MGDGNKIGTLRSPYPPESNTTRRNVLLQTRPRRVSCSLPPPASARARDTGGRPPEKLRRPPRPDSCGGGGTHLARPNTIRRYLWLTVAQVASCTGAQIPCTDCRRGRHGSASEGDTSTGRHGSRHRSGPGETRVDTGPDTGPDTGTGRHGSRHGSGETRVRVRGRHEHGRDKGRHGSRHGQGGDTGRRETSQRL